MKLELHGSSDENISNVKKLLTQFKFEEKRITNDELLIETEFYRKDDLVAELIEFESTYLIIYLSIK